MGEITKSNYNEIRTKELDNNYAKVWHVNEIRDELLASTPEVPVDAVTSLSASGATMNKPGASFDLSTYDFTSPQKFILVYEYTDVDLNNWNPVGVLGFLDYELVLPPGLDPKAIFIQHSLNVIYPRATNNSTTYRWTSWLEYIAGNAYAMIYARPVPIVNITGAVDTAIDILQGSQFIINIEFTPIP